MPIKLKVNAKKLATHAVDVERDDGQGGDARGGVDEDWQPERSAVACLLAPRAAAVPVTADAPVPVRSFTVVFFAPITLGPARRLVFADPATGTPRYLYPGPARDAVELGVVIVADADEFE